MRLHMHLAYALVALSLMSSLSNVVSATEEPENLVRICDIKAHEGDFIGKVVTIDALYSTDSMVYSFLEDPTCKKGDMLDLGFRVPERDQSVSDFYAAKADYCRKRDLAMCIVHARVRVRGASAEAVGAHLAPNARYLVVNLHSVLSFEFIDRR